MIYQHRQTILFFYSLFDRFGSKTIEQMFNQSINHWLFFFFEWKSSDDDVILLYECVNEKDLTKRFKIFTHWSLTHTHSSSSNYFIKLFVFKKKKCSNCVIDELEFEEKLSIKLKFVWKRCLSLKWKEKTNYLLSNVGEFSLWDT